MPSKPRPKRSQSSSQVIGIVIISLFVGCCVAGGLQSRFAPRDRALVLDTTVTLQPTTEIVAIPALADTPSPVIPAMTPPRTATPLVQEYLLNEGASEYFDVIPADRLAGIGDGFTMVINGSRIAITLQSVNLLQPTGNKERRFDTTFVVRNEGQAAFVFEPSKLLMGANDSGFRMSRGSAAKVRGEHVETLAPGEEKAITVEWATQTYNEMSGGLARQVVWITVNTPIDENSFVELPSDAKVFVFVFPAVPLSHRGTAGLAVPLHQTGSRSHSVSPLRRKMMSRPASSPSSPIEPAQHGL